MTEANEQDRVLNRAEEALVVDIQVYLHRVMEAKGMSRAQLAKAMGVSRARVSQIFSAECKNFTIRLLARAAAALGEEVEIGSEVTRQQDLVRANARRDVAMKSCTNVAELASHWTDEGETDDFRAFADAGRWVSNHFGAGAGARERIAA